MARIFAALVLLVTTALSAQPTIRSVTPSSGPVAGGTTVVIRGSGFETSCSPAPQPCGRTSVLFDSVDAISFRVIDSNTIEAVTPPNFPGTATVGVSLPKGGAAFSKAFTYTGDITDAFERILVPLYIPPTSGAFGSRFVTELSIWGIAGPSIPAFGIGYDCSGIMLCPPPPPIFVTVFRARQSAPAANFNTYGDPGLLFWVPNGAYDRLAATLRASDLSRRSETWGTTIPLAPQREFRSDFLALLDVPVTPRFRDTLRMYSLDPATSVHVRVIRSDSTAIYSEFVVDLRNPADMFHPGYAQISDFGNVPPDTVRIEIEPRSAGKRIWAFASITNNETQHITIVTPH